jgi:FtsP/CotA-like multicopper oxidase with cupredoxin domain
MWQIGAEGGFFAGSVPVRSLVLAPAERADVLVDFSRLAGRTTTMRNLPLPPGVSNPGPQLPQVMQIRVANTTPMAPMIPTAIVGGRDADLSPPPEANRRFITLNEVNVDTADWILTLNGDPYMSVPEQGATEQVAVNAVQDWYYINLTGDTHPMHTHLITFQVVARVPFDVGRYVADAPAAGKVGPFGVEGGIDPTPYATGLPRPDDPTERGFKETVKANPGEFTIIRAKFELPAGATLPQKYVHHCHIVEHEDNEMMRPYTVVA